MPKEGYKKFGDPRFDNKQPCPDLFEPRNEKQKEEIFEYKFALKFKKMAELMQFFDIDPRDENAWMHLAFELAEHYVPAMQFTEKPGARKKWTNTVCWGLHALYIATKNAQTSKTTKKATFYSMPALISGTCLEKLIESDVKGERLREEYDAYIKTADFELRSGVVEATLTEDEKNQYFSEYLKKEPSGEFKEYCARLNETVRKDAVFTFLSGGRPQTNQKNFAYLSRVLKKTPEGETLIKELIGNTKTG